MNDTDLWPFMFEVNIVHRASFSERTLFVHIEEDGQSHWVDDTGRRTHAGVGELTFDDDMKPVEIRGGKRLTAEEMEREREEFTIHYQMSAEQFLPIKEFILKIGQRWPFGWKADDSRNLHEMLEPIYWRDINHLVFQPFDNTGR